MVDRVELSQMRRFPDPMFVLVVCSLVKKISEVRRCLRLSRNVEGRDLVVGDLHGHRSLFEQELERLDFDPTRDRVLSVGDLVDRGPESIASLSLITEPWFHAVLGNHELMLLNFLGYFGSRVHSRKSFPTAGGDWIIDAIKANRKAVMALADRIASLPVAIHVDAEVAFNVTHADLHPIGSRQGKLFTAKMICVDKADAVTTSRCNIGRAMKSALLDLQFGRHSVRISSTPLGELPITYVGHSPIRAVTVHDSYVHIDQCAGARRCRQAAAIPPTVIDHHEFGYWLAGVATACAVAAPAATRSSQVNGALHTVAALA